MRQQNAHLYEQLEAMLTSAQLGDVASDHRAELNGFRGWNYVAITAVGKMAARAIVRVYRDKSPEVREERREKRAIYGANWVRKSQQGLEGKSEILLPTDPLVHLLKQPNPRQTGASFRWEQVQQLRLHGSCLVFNRPNMAHTRTVERYVLPIGICVPIAPNAKKGFPNGGVRIMPQRSTWGLGPALDSSPVRALYFAEIPTERLTIARYPHPVYRGDGASPSTAISPWIDTSFLIDTTRVEFYQEGPNGKIVFATDTSDPVKIADLERRLNDKLGANGPRVVVVGNHGSVISQKTAEDMGFSDTFNQMRTGTFSAHGVSRSLTGDQDSMTYGGLAASLYAAALLSVQPDMDLLAAEDTLDLSEEYGRDITIEYDVPGIEDPELEDKRLEADAVKSIMTVGEYRTKRGQPLFGNEYDNYIMTPSGPQPLEALMKGKAQAASAPSMPVMPPIQLSRQRKAVVQWSQISSEPDPAEVAKLEAAGYEVNLSLNMEPTSAPPYVLWDTDLQPTAKELLTVLPEGDERDALQAIVDSQTEYRYGCVMLRLPEAAARHIRELGASIPDEMIGAGGREDEPHVTVLYGITGASLQQVVELVSKMTAPTITFRQLSTFPQGDNGFPLKIDVESPELVKMNATLRARLPHVESYPDYKPHATVAYLSSLEGIPADSTLGNYCCTPTEVIVSMPGEPKAIVPLRVLQPPRVNPIASVDPVEIVQKAVRTNNDSLVAAIAAQNEILVRLVKQVEKLESRDRKEGESVSS